VFSGQSERLGGILPNTGRRVERRTKAIAEVLAMITDAYPELAPDRPDYGREAEEWLWEIASGFCAALDRYAARTMQVKREHY
jgi:hypothetical protein